MALTLTDDNYTKEAGETDKLVVIDFWAAWCGPCRMLAPIIEELSTEYQDKAVIAKLDVDNNPQISSKFMIRSLPTILFIKDGEVVDKQVGLTTKTALSEKIKAHL